MSFSALIRQLSLFSGLLALPLFATVDRNLDGLSDFWAQLHPAAADPAGDPDGDGATNLAESRAGTDPLNAASRFTATVEPTTADQFQLRWSSVVGKSYQLESSPNLTDWTPFLAPFAGTGVTLNSPLGSPGSSVSGRLFWRVAVRDLDTDSDGLDDAEETLLGTSPASADTDADGLTDQWELDHGSNPTVASFTEAAPDTLFKLCTAAVPVGGTTETHYFHFKAPATYNAARTTAYPLVVYLHPFGHANRPEDLHDNSPYAPGDICELTSSAMFPAFVYVPVCPPPYSPTSGLGAPEGGQWNSPAAKAMVVATIENLCQRFNIDRRRIYLAGFSMGGSGSYYIADAFHQITGSRFAAVSRGAGMSPSLAAFPQIHASLALSPVWIHVGENDDGITTLGIEAYNQLELVRLAQGGEKTTAVRSAGAGLIATPYPLDLVADVSTVTLGGNPVARLSVYRGRGHEGHLMFQNADLFPWMFAQQLPELPLPRLPLIP